MEHDWKCIEVGNWYSEYQCQSCGEKFVEQPDDPDCRRPKMGCPEKESGSSLEPYQYGSMKAPPSNF